MAMLIKKDLNLHKYQIKYIISSDIRFVCNILRSPRIIPVDNQDAGCKVSIYQTRKVFFIAVIVAPLSKNAPPLGAFMWINTVVKRLKLFI